jgi:hypothetical protein
MKRIALFFAVIMIEGCAALRPVKKNPVTTGPTTRQITISVHSAADPRDPLPKLPVLIHLDIYQFDVPFGSISSNVAFWKRVDEQTIGDGPATTEVLFNNGFRCGIAAKSDWAFFRDFLNQLPNRTRKTTITKDRVAAMDLDIDNRLRDEDLFFFDSRNQSHGRTYQSCRNSLTLSFEPAPRDPSSVRMAVCPVVTSQRHRLEFSALNQEYESPFEEISRLYDMNLTANIPENDFLIVSPSRDAIRTTSVGGQFLVNNDKAERLEQVLVIVPTFLRLDGKPFTLTDTSLPNARN